MYIKRSLEHIIREMSAHFLRHISHRTSSSWQTTLLEHAEAGQRSYVTLDDLNQRLVAQQNPAALLTAFNSCTVG